MEWEKALLDGQEMQMERISLLLMHDCAIRICNRMVHCGIWN